MIKKCIGNIFDSKANIICHQTNCLGVMGGGIALQVKKKYPEVYKEYFELCKEKLNRNYTDDLLGEVQYCRINDTQYIANLFGQRSVSAKKRQTNYTALTTALNRVRCFCLDEPSNPKTIAIPYKIGCGLGGGDWQTVEHIIEELFADEDIVCEIWQLEEEIDKKEIDNEVEDNENGN